MTTRDLYQIVDEQDNLIGAKPRNEIDFKNGYYRISGLWLTSSNGQILIAQRLLTKDKDPGKWGPAAAGTLEVGETYESNAYKEAEEEIGLTGVTFTQGPKMKFTTPRHSFCQWYTAVCDKPESVSLHPSQPKSSKSDGLMKMRSLKMCVPIQTSTCQQCH